jgi:hypothetical protein
MANRVVILSVVAVLVLAAQPARAQRGGRPGGGHPGGGGHSGYGRAVPRGGGSPGYVPGGVSQARHPRAGTGYAAYRPPYAGHYPSHGNGRYPVYGYGGHYPRYGYGYYPRYGYGYYPRYGYGYYPRHGYSYYPYYGGSVGFYFGVGSPYFYGSLAYGWPYAYGSYGYAPPATTHVYLPPREQVEDADRSSDLRIEDPRSTADRSVPNTGRVRLEVRPDDATVYVDDEFWGSARESRFMTLRAGRHSIEIVRPGYDVVRREVDVTEGETLDVLVELQRP